MKPRILHKVEVLLELRTGCVNIDIGLSVSDSLIIFSYSLSYKFVSLIFNTYNSNSFFYL